MLGRPLPGLKDTKIKTDRLCSAYISTFLYFFSLGPKAKLMLRYPDGKREQITLPEKAKLMVSIVYLKVPLKQMPEVIKSSLLQ